MSQAAEVIESLRALGATVATAESLTGGQLSAALIDVPGASDVVAGGIVAYSVAAKTDVLGVATEVIAANGTVDADVAEAMAVAARDRFASTYAISTTGVAGPGASEGHPAGTVFLGLAGPEGVDSCRLALDGGRAAVREGTVGEALSWMVARLGEETR